MEYDVYGAVGTKAMPMTCPALVIFSWGHHKDFLSTPLYQNKSEKLKTWNAEMQNTCSMSSYLCSYFHFRKNKYNS